LLPEANGGGQIAVGVELLFTCGFEIGHLESGLRVQHLARPVGEDEYFLARAAPDEIDAMDAAEAPVMPIR